MPARTELAKSVFLAALEIPGADARRVHVAAACDGDEELRREVEQLLRHHEAAGAFLERPAEATAENADLSPSGLPPEPGGAERAGLVLAGRYKLLELVGEGGMGGVWTAEQTEPVRRVVAVKLIKPGMDSRQVVARFEAERQALAMMDHPNIAKVLDAGTAPDGRPFFVMELVKGAPITRFCDDRRLTPRQRLGLFVQVCAAVQHAHQKGVIHRDLKPSNVLVALYDDTPVPKVIDFGVAKATGQPLTERTLHTGLGAVVGTPEYMSPEQASFNNRDVDTRSDVYSLGVLLYELLAGSPPFSRKVLESAGLLEVLRGVREVEPPRPSARLSTAEALLTLAANRGTEPRRLCRLLRGELDWVVMKALEKDRARRYETAAGFAEDLQRYLADEPVQAARPSVAYRLGKFARRNRGAVAAAGVVALAVVAGVAGTAWQAVRATGERDARQRALDVLGAEQGRTRAALDQAKLRLAELAFDKGQLLGERGDADLALLWLARSLRLAPPDAVEFRAAVRAGLGAWRQQVNALRLALPHDGGLYGVGFTPDDRLVTANVSRDGSALIVRRWDAAANWSDAPLPFPFPAGMDGWKVVCFSPDGGYLLVCYTGGDGGVVRLEDATTGKAVWEAPRTEHGNGVSAVFSPDGTRVLVGYFVGGEQGEHATGLARVYDAATGKPLGDPLEHRRPVYAAAFHPDGKGFVTACGLWHNATEGGQTVFWDGEGRKTREVEHDSGIQAVAFSRDGTRLLTGHMDGTARLWAPAAPLEALRLRHDAPLITTDFGPEDKILVTGSFDGTVRVWDAAGRLLGQPMRHGRLVQATTLRRDGKAVAVGVRGGNAARLWDLAAAVPDGTPEPGFFPLAFSPDRRTTLTLEADKTTAQLQDAATGRPVGRRLPHPKPVFIGGATAYSGRRHACNSDRRWALTVDVANVARLWNAQTGKGVELKWSADPSAQPLFYGAAFSPDGNVVVTGDFLGTIRVWNPADGKRRQWFAHEEDGPVFEFAFSADGKVLLSAGADNFARLWDLATGQSLGPPLAHANGAYAVALSPDGTTAATGGADPTVPLWDLATRRPRLHLSGHQGGVNDLAFSLDGRLILTASKDQTARLWDVATGKPIGPPLRHPGPVAQVVFGLDGRTIRTGTDDQLGRSWPVPVPVAGDAEQLELWAQVVTGQELGEDDRVRILDYAGWQTRRELLGGFEPVPRR
jgi:WD40 repeat protein